MLSARLRHAIVPALVKLQGLGKLAQWTDDAMTFEHALPTVEEADLASADAALVALVVAINAARFQLTPPPSVSIELPQWQALEIGRAHV